MKCKLNYTCRRSSNRALYLRSDIKHMIKCGRLQIISNRMAARPVGETHTVQLAASATGDGELCGPLKKYSSSTVQCTWPEHTIKLSCCAAERALRMKRLSRVELRLRLRPRRLRSPEMGAAAADISPFCGRAN